MSKYTTEVRFICERYAGFSESADRAEVNDIINAAIPQIFDFDFPIWDASYKNVLCKKILRHYYTREIGCETVGLWKLRLESKLNEIMPYYNRRYETTVYEFNPLYDVDYTKTVEGTDAGTSQSGNTRTFNENVKETEEGSIEDNHTGTGSVQHGYNSSDTVNEDRDRRETHTGTDTITKTGTETDVIDRDTTGTHTDAYSDTPQGTVDNVLQGTYLTNFRQVLDQGTEDVTDTTTFNTTNMETRALNDSAVEDNSITKVKSGTDTDSETRNFKDKRDVDTEKNNTHTGTIGDAGAHEFENTKDYTEHVIGKMPGTSYMKMINELRDSLINIDMEIIEDLSDLFMKLW